MPKCTTIWPMTSDCNNSLQHLNYSAKGFFSKMKCVGFDSQCDFDIMMSKIQLTRSSANAFWNELHMTVLSMRNCAMDDT